LCFFVVLPYFIVLILLGVLVATDLAEAQFFFEYMIATTLLIAFAYYIRTTSSLVLWRAIWVMVGVGLVGFPIFLVLNFLLIKTLSPVVGFLIPFSITMATQVLVGAFVGDQIGKRRRYKPII
jgi:hypothetical protein